MSAWQEGFPLRAAWRVCVCVCDCGSPTKDSRVPVVHGPSCSDCHIRPFPLETQECLGAAVLRGPPAGQDERRGAAGAHEAAPEGAGPGAQEDAEPGREDGPALVPLPRPHASRRPWLSMLGRSRQAGLGQGAALPRVPPHTGGWHPPGQRSTPRGAGYPSTHHAGSGAGSPW